MKFTINEKDLAGKVMPGAVMLEKVRKAREKLTEGVDFINSTVGVMFSVDGVKKLTEAMKLEDPGKKAQATIKKTETVAQTLMNSVLQSPDKKSATKLMPFTGNRKYLKGFDAETGQEMTIHVRDNVNFTRDMTIEVVRGFAGSWDYLGPMPRARGRM